MHSNYLYESMDLVDLQASNPLALLDTAIKVPSPCFCIFMNYGQVASSHALLGSPNLIISFKKEIIIDPKVKSLGNNGQSLTRNMTLNQ